MEKLQKMLEKDVIINQYLNLNNYKKLLIKDFLKILLKLMMIVYQLVNIINKQNLINAFKLV